MAINMPKKWNNHSQLKTDLPIFSSLMSKLPILVFYLITFGTFSFLKCSRICHHPVITWSESIDRTCYPGLFPASQMEKRVSTLKILFLRWDFVRTFSQYRYFFWVWLNSKLEVSLVSWLHNLEDVPELTI